MSDEAQELCMRRGHCQIISDEGVGMGDMLVILLEKKGMFLLLSIKYCSLGLKQA